MSTQGCLWWGSPLHLFWKWVNCSSSWTCPWPCPDKGLRPGLHFLFVDPTSHFKCSFSHMWEVILPQWFQLHLPLQETSLHEQEGVLPRHRLASGCPEPWTRANSTSLALPLDSPPGSNRAKGAPPSAHGMRPEWLSERFKATRSFQYQAPWQHVGLPCFH